MDKTKRSVSYARPAKVLTKSTFKNYDLCANPYVGCEFGCTYCYVRFFIKDPNKEWGEFVRIRGHIEDKLPKELDKGFVSINDGRTQVLENGVPVVDGNGKIKTRPAKKLLSIDTSRLVIGTMTDPYQPVERKHRITRKTLEILTTHKNQFQKVGIFTRSPIVLDDLDLIKKLPKARIHYTITPFPADVIQKIEPVSVMTKTRWKTCEQIKQSGIRLHINVSPAIPFLSDEFVEEFAQNLAKIQPHEFFVDPMQPYKESFESFQKAMSNDTKWDMIKETMTDNERYNKWKDEFRKRWTAAWNKYGSNTATLPIWCDHQNKTWVDMRTGKQMNHRHYGDETI